MRLSKQTRKSSLIASLKHHTEALAFIVLHWTNAHKQASHLLVGRLLQFDPHLGLDASDNLGLRDDIGTMLSNVLEFFPKDIHPSTRTGDDIESGGWDDGIISEKDPWSWRRNSLQ